MIEIDIEIQGNKYTTGFQPIVYTYFPNGSIARMLLDSGASKTCFDKNSKNTLLFPTGHNSTGTGHGGTTDLSLSIGKLAFKYFIEINSYTVKENFVYFAEKLVCSIDMTEQNKRLEQYNLGTLDGILGTDFLIEHNMTIDFSRMKLIIP